MTEQPHDKIIGNQCPKSTQGGQPFVRRYSQYSDKSTYKYYQRQTETVEQSPHRRLTRGGDNNTITYAHSLNRTRDVDNLDLLFRRMTRTCHFTGSTCRRLNDTDMNAPVVNTVHNTFMLYFVSHR